MASDGDPSLTSLRAARDEARETLDHQARTAEDLDGKAVNLLHFDATVATVMATALPAADVVGVDPAALLNPYTVTGVVALFLSAAVAGVAYTMNTQFGGVGPGAVEETADRDLPPETFYRRLLAGYAVWIRRNRVRNARRTPLVTATLLATVAAMASLALGAGVAMTGSLPWFVPVAAGVAVAGAAYASRLHEQVARALRTDGRPVAATREVSLEGVEPFRGEQVSTGAENREA